jgi:glycosyltransferase involved in cell wall biosynthesis
VLVQAAALLGDRFPELRYLIVGSVAPGNEDHLYCLKQLIQANALEDKIIFAGDITDIRNVYAAVDVTVVPSIQPEPFGCVVMESMAQGTPVIGSRCGGIPEQIVDLETGMLFEPGNAVELAEALSLLIRNRTLRETMGQAGQERCREVFQMRKTYEQLARCFEVLQKPVKQKLRHGLR